MFQTRDSIRKTASGTGIERRKSDRLALKGAVLIYREPEAMAAGVLHDVSDGGCAFFCAEEFCNKLDRTFSLDILVYNNEDRSQYFLDHINGFCVARGKDTSSGAGEYMLYHICFRQPDVMHRNVLQELLLEHGGVRRSRLPKA